MLSKNTSGILKDLQADIQRLEGFRLNGHSPVDMGLGTLNDSFPNSTFPLGAVHEFLLEHSTDAAATIGFIGGLLSALMGSNGTAVWISSSRTLFPPALKSFGLEPDRFIFIDLKKEKDVIWAVDEALKCGGLSAVVGEMQQLDFITSRRLQLSVEQSKVTGFVIRKNNRSLSTTACVSRWKITSLPSEPVDNLPGIGFPKWHVELLRMRNGKSGVWDIEWRDRKFIPVFKSPTYDHVQQKKVG